MLKKIELTDPASCLNKAEDDEMVFVLLGRDPAATEAIRAWIEARIRIGKNRRNDAQIKEAEGCIAEMCQFLPVYVARRADRERAIRYGLALSRARAAGLSDEDIAALTLKPTT